MDKEDKRFLGILVLGFLLLVGSFTGLTMGLMVVFPFK